MIFRKKIVCLLASLVAFWTLDSLTSCSSLHTTVQPRSVASHAHGAEGGEYDWQQGNVDEQGWQSYEWHAETDTTRLRQIADSLIALGQPLPNEVRGVLGRSNYVEAEVPSLCHDLVNVARNYIGCRYGSGKSGPDRFDCSGFTSYIFGLHGMHLGRSSRDQFLQGVDIADTRDLRPADLVFWTGGNRHRKEVGHVGIVVSVNREAGTFTFIHAARTGIQIDQSEAPYYAARYKGARRIIE